MDGKTVFLITIAAIVSIAVVLFQYFYKGKKMGRLGVILALLRFVVLFLGLFLLINPKLEKDDFYLQKSKLLVLVDNSTSISEYSGTTEIQQQLDKILSDPDLDDRFEIIPFRFGSELSGLDSLTFRDKNTNIGGALQESLALTGSENTVVALLTDGNQTFGSDYQYLKLGETIEVAPIVLGDTTKYEDFLVSRIDLNKYAFLGNRFPIETTINYQGKVSKSAVVKILLNGRTAHRETISFSRNAKSKTVTAEIAANTVGVKSVVVEVEAFEGEKNKLNNKRETVIEVIDEKTNIILVSNMLHPDIGALKRAIESNEQRLVKIVKPTVATTVLDEADMVILYQPASNFTDLAKRLDERAIPTFTVSGTNTDFRFLNSTNEARFSVATGYPEQEVFGRQNNAFSQFDISQFTVDGYPPLLSNAGPVTVKGETDFLLRQEIKGVEMDSPLMALWTQGKTKHLALFGENIWQWRAQSFRDNGNFESFDAFVGKLMVYLSQSGKRDRLEIDYEKAYSGASGARLRASFFDKTFVFDPNANLVLSIKNGQGDLQEIPMIVKGNYFEAGLDNLPPGSYDFTVGETNENISKSGSFRILEFETEKQFLSSDYERLATLAQNNNGAVYFSQEVDDLLQKLNADSRYVPIQKNRQKVVSFIDFRVVLGIMALALALEWIIRKYNGLL